MGLSISQRQARTTRLLSQMHKVVRQRQQAFSHANAQRSAEAKQGVSVHLRASNVEEKQGVRQLNRALNLTQNSGVALSELHGLLTDIRALAIESAIQTYTEAERAVLQQDFETQLDHLNARMPVAEPEVEPVLSVVTEGRDSLTFVVDLSEQPIAQSQALDKMVRELRHDLSLEHQPTKIDLAIVRGRADDIVRQSQVQAIATIDQSDFKKVIDALPEHSEGDQSYSGIVQLSNLKRTAEKSQGTDGHHNSVSRYPRRLDFVDQYLKRSARAMDAEAASGTHRDPGLVAVHKGHDALGTLIKETVSQVASGRSGTLELEQLAAALFGPSALLSLSIATPEQAAQAVRKLDSFLMQTELRQSMITSEQQRLMANIDQGAVDFTSQVPSVELDSDSAISKSMAWLEGLEQEGAHAQLRPALDLERHRLTTLLERSYQRKA